MYATAIFGLVLRERGQHEKRKGIGLRVIQLLAVALVVPLVPVLCAAGKLQRAETVSLLGPIVGFVLSDGRRKDEEPD